MAAAVTMPSVMEFAGVAGGAKARTTGAARDASEPLLEQLSSIKIDKPKIPKHKDAPTQGIQKQGDSTYGVFDTVPFTPSQGVKSPSPPHPRAYAYGMVIYSPCKQGWNQATHSSPNTVLHADGSSDAASNASPPVHYAVYPYSMPYSPQLGSGNEPPSPLMGSPVPTPRAMKFSQTPFAGAQTVQHFAYSPSYHQPRYNPFMPEAPQVPGSPPIYQGYHPIFSFQPNVAIPSPPSPPAKKTAARVAVAPVAAKVKAPDTASTADASALFEKKENVKGQVTKDAMRILVGSCQSSKVSTGRSSPAIPIIQDAMEMSAPSDENGAISPASSAAVPSTSAKGLAAGSTESLSQGGVPIGDTGFSLESLASTGGLNLIPDISNIHLESLVGAVASMPFTDITNITNMPLPNLFNISSGMGPASTTLPVYDMLAAASWTTQGSMPSQIPITSGSMGFCAMPMMSSWSMGYPGMMDPTNGLNIAYGLPSNLAGPGSVQGGVSNMGPQGMQRGMMNRSCFRPYRPRRGTQDLRYGPDGLPRLNARQRRTLRRARERAINGLMEAGRVLLQKDGVPDFPSRDKKKGADADDSSDDGSTCHNEETARYMDAAMSVASGSAGPKAAADAAQVLTKVAADLDDGDLGNLISQLSNNRKQEGVVDDSLIRDLQIIQNLITSLKTQGR